MGSSIGVDKWLVMGALVLLSAFFGALPYFILKKVKSLGNVFNYSTYHQVLTFLSCLGAGVLLATTLVHMLPENRLSFEASEFALETFDDHFPIAEILTIIGFVLIYFLEELAHFILSSSGGTNAFSNSHGHSHTFGRQEALSSDGNLEKPGADAGEIEKDSSLTYGTGRKRLSLLDIHASSRTSVHLHLESSPPPTPDSSTNSKTELHPPTPSLSLSIEEEGVSAPAASQLTSFLALIALSFHAVMEGIAIGIQNSTNLWLMFGAIASHKFVISFCMGMELCAAKARPTVFISSILLFALLSPAGIFIGSFLTSTDSSSTFSTSVVEGLATGTLLYVVFCEILSRERERKSTVLASSRFSGFIQFFGVVVGAVAMVCLLTLIDHGHNHNTTEDTDHSHDDDNHDHDHDHDH